MQYLYQNFASTYGSGSYNSGTFNNSTAKTSSGGGTTGGKTTTGAVAPGNSNANPHGGSLVDTGFIVIAVVTLAVIIIFVSLIVRFVKKPASKPGPSENS